MSESNRESDKENQCSEKEDSRGRIEFIGISIGDKFSNIKEFLAKINEVQKNTSVQLWNRDSRTLEGAKKRYPLQVANANPQLKYYSLHMACVCGGKKQSDKATKRKVRYSYLSNVHYDQTV